MSVVTTGHLLGDIVEGVWYMYPMGKNRGVTLLELLITVAIAAVLLSMAIPSFDGLIKRNRLNSAYNALLGELSYTRSEAVQRAQTVSICASSDDATCNSANWESGRLVFVDINANGDFDVADDTLLKVFNGSEAGVTIRTSAFTDTGGIVYDADGGLSNNNNNDTGTLIVCGVRGASYAKGANVSLMGQPQKAYDSDADGTVEDLAGGAVTCP